MRIQLGKGSLLRNDGPGSRHAFSAQRKLESERAPRARAGGARGPLSPQSPICSLRNDNNNNVTHSIDTTHVFERGCACALLRAPLPRYRQSSALVCMISACRPPPEWWALRPAAARRRLLRLARWSIPSTMRTCAARRPASGRAAAAASSSNRSSSSPCCSPPSAHALLARACRAGSRLRRDLGLGLGPLLLGHLLLVL